MDILQPPDWAPPRGYANGVACELTVGSKLLFLAGMIGWNGQQQFETDDLAEQVRVTLENIVATLAAGGAKPQHIVRMTWYVKDKQAYVQAYPEIGRHYRAIIGKHFPAMTAVQVADLVEDRALVEIEATAVVPGLTSPNAGD